MRLSGYIFAICAGMMVWLASSCSTVRVLGEKEKRLVSNKIEILNGKDIEPAELSPYLKQKTKSWNPALYVYNWENGKGGKWDKFVHKVGTAPVIYDSTLVSSTIVNLQDHLEYLGFYKSKVVSSVDTTRKKKARVKYSVTLGKQYPIRNIAYSIPYKADFSKDFNEDNVNSLIKPGERLRESLLESESLRRATHMRNNGYYDFSKNFFFFEADTLVCPDSADLRIMVKTHTRNEKEDVEHNFDKYYIGKVSVSYPQDLRFREKVLKDLNNLSSGDLYREQRINTAYSRFNSVSLFRSVNMNVTPRDSLNLVDCNIALEKGKIQGFKVGLEASVNTNGLFGISPELSYYNRNIFRGGEIFNLAVRTNHQFKIRNTNVKSNEVSVNTSLVFPRFLPFSTRRFHGPDLPRTEVKAAFNYQNRPEYERNIFSTSFGYSGTFRRKTFSYQISPISINYIHLLKIDPTFLQSIEKNMFLLNSFKDQFDMGITSSLYYNSAGTLNPKFSYWYWRVGVDVSGNLLSLFKGFMPVNNESGGPRHLVFGVPFNQYVMGEVSIGKTFVWGAKDGQAFAMRFLAGAGHAYGNSFSMPYDKAFYSGGANSLRGWTAKTVGPGRAPLETYWTIPNQVGDMKLEANLEYRFLMFWKIAGALFVDAGNIWMIGKPQQGVDPRSYLTWDTMGESIAADWGIGLRLDLSFLVLRFDFGMKVHDPALETDSWIGPNRWFKSGNNAFHFGVGYPF